MTDTPIRVYWRFEDGPEDTDLDDDPEDVGRAWLSRPDGRAEALHGGASITRIEALRLAIQYGYELDEDG